jgi:hypothetical protein
MLRRRRGLSAAALARDLAHRAAEVHVDVVDAAFADQQTHGLSHVVGIDAVELQAARLLLGGEAGQQQGLAIAHDQSAGGDHLAHVEPGAVAAAQRTEGRVRDAGHRREHHRGPDAQRADGSRAELAGTRERHVSVLNAPVDGVQRSS